MTLGRAILYVILALLALWVAWIVFAIFGHGESCTGVGDVPTECR
jgi:hypothetical protein